MADVKFYKVTALPAEPATANAFYIVESGDDAEIFVTDNSGNFHDTGNTNFIQAFIDAITGQPSGLATLDSGGKVPLAQIPAQALSGSRVNHVVVTSEADFPAAAGGTITLDANTAYEINGTVGTDKILVLNGAILFGVDPEQDILHYMSSGNRLIGGSEGGHIYNLTLKADNGTAKVFDVNDTGGDQELIVFNVNIVDSVNVGDIQGYESVLWENVKFDTNTAGVTFDSIDRLNITGFRADATNTGTIIALTGTMQSISIIGGFIEAVASVTGLDVSSLTIADQGAIHGMVVYGAGTKITGTIDVEWDIHLAGPEQDNADRNAYGIVSIGSPSETAIATLNVPVKVAGTTNFGLSHRTSNGAADNRIQYDGKNTIVRRVEAHVSLVSATATKTFSIYIAKNGVVIAESQIKVTLNGPAVFMSSSCGCITSLATGDYVELWIENNTDTENCTAHYMQLMLH